MDVFCRGFGGGAGIVASVGGDGGGLGWTSRVVGHGKRRGRRPDQVCFSRNNIMVEVMVVPPGDNDNINSPKASPMSYQAPWEGTITLNLAR